MAVTQEARALHSQLAGLQGEALHLRDEDVVSLDGDVRTKLDELGRRLEIDSREVIIFIHRKFLIVAYSW